ncbi:alginate export family protein [Candidatus Manganitrophus noduliformans]|uniref:alginate export family protein n=1 Tax=Candidatus Manganitrophus noduliformans TaxID=2606439 RepID=UPI0014396300|nr:alginate export family protein [Candidatus Manganitrophus noduliformans]
MIRILLVLIVLLIDRSTLLALENGQEVSKEGRPAPNGKNEVPPVIDPDASPALSFEITPRLSVGAKIEINFLRRINRDLDRAEEDDRIDTEASLDLAAQLILTKDILFFVDLDFSDERLFRDGEGQAERETKGQFDRLYLLWERFFSPSLDLQVGRQRFNDAREWLYDEELDAVRLFYTQAPFDLELSASTNLLDPEGPEEKIRNYVLYGTYQFGRKEKISVYVVAQRDPTDEERNPNFVGLLWRGKAIEDQKYWLEIASLSGREDSTRLSGYAFDFAWTSEFDLPLEPSVTIGYAFGSGDPEPEDGVDRNFRQTGLQDNEAKFNGVRKFKYYGELFDPELSNMRIRTLGFGIIPFEKFSFDVVFHSYSLVYSGVELRDTGIREDPSGTSKNLGKEVDLIVGFKMTPEMLLEVSTAAFVPGKAFPGAGNAYSGEVTIRVSF